MPWDGTELWVADIGSDLRLGKPRRIAGGVSESVLAPMWSPAGALHWISDRTGWWNVYASRNGSVHPVCPDVSEFAVAPWQHGRRPYGFLADGSIVAVRIRDAVHEIVRIAPGITSAQAVGPRITWVVDGHVSCRGSTAAFAGASPTAGDAVLAFDAHSGRTSTIAADPPGWPADAIVAGTPLRFAGEDASSPVHGFWYEPRVDVGRSAAHRQPPLILHLHGGPTDSAHLGLDSELQMWTSRGFAVLDLNYSSSTGYGSAYRHRLDGEWGRRDLADCLAAVSYLARMGMVDPERVFVRGASAGGYLTLQCVTASPAFAGGMCRCGIADLALWREDTHDFESRYTDLLVGPRSEIDRYRRRSPARNVGPGAAPLLLIHGLADTVVPPEHAKRMAAAYRDARRPCAVELLPDEPHGLRRQESRERWLAAELAFVAASRPELATVVNPTSRKE
jgi:dipeptidyl aminopeptidase/acylaminoacyl peptidase